MSANAGAKTRNVNPSHAARAVAYLFLLLSIAFAGSASADDVTFGFAAGMGGSTAESGNESGRAIAVDSSGNVYTTGWYNGTTDFDPGPGTFELTSSGGEFDEDIFVSKLDSSGNFVWAKSMGGTSLFDQGSGIVVDASGNVYVTGSFFDTADFDPDPGTTVNLTSAGGWDIFVCKLDTSGNLVWAKSMGGMGTDEGFDIALDASGNVYTTGKFTGTADFNPAMPTFNLTSAGGTLDADIFVSKLSPTGSFEWAKSMGGTDFDEGRGVVVDASGNVHTAGRFGATADFNPSSGGSNVFNLTSAGDENIFVSKLDSLGDFVWAKRMGGTGLSKAFDIVLGDSGAVYTTGEFQDSADFDPGMDTFSLASAGVWDVFVSKLDSAGDFLWAKRMGGTNDDSGFGIALDALDNVYTTGRFRSTVDFDPGSGVVDLSSAGVWDIFVSKLDSAGNYLWAKKMGGPGLDLGLDVVVDASNNVYTTGHFQSMADFDPGAGTFNLTTAMDGGLDIFVSKLVPVGVLAEVWVDFGFGGSEDGSETNPFNLLAEGLAETAPFGTVKIKGNTGSPVSGETMRIDRAVTIKAVNGTVYIGAPGGRSAEDGLPSGFVSRNSARPN